MSLQPMSARRLEKLPDAFSEGLEAENRALIGRVEGQIR